VEAAFAAQPALQAAHPAVVARVIVAKQMQQTMESEDPQFRLLGVPGLQGLAPGHASRDHDLTQQGLRAPG